MDFELTDEQALLKAAVREFAEGEIAPGAADRDEQARFPAELIPKLAEQGLLGIFAPEEYGGSGYDAISAAIILEEVARVDAAVALSLVLVVVAVVVIGFAGRPGRSLG